MYVCLCPPDDVIGLKCSHSFDYIHTHVVRLYTSPYSYAFVLVQVAHSFINLTLLSPCARSNTQGTLFLALALSLALSHVESVSGCANLDLHCYVFRSTYSCCFTTTLPPTPTHPAIELTARALRAMRVFVCVCVYNVCMRDIGLACAVNAQSPTTTVGIKVYTSCTSRSFSRVAQHFPRIAHAQTHTHTHTNTLNFPTAATVCSVPNVCLRACVKIVNACFYFFLFQSASSNTLSHTLSLSV